MYYYSKKQLMVIVNLFHHGSPQSGTQITKDKNKDQCLCYLKSFIAFYHSPKNHSKIEHALCSTPHTITGPCTGHVHSRFPFLLSAKFGALLQVSITECSTVALSVVSCTNSTHLYGKYTIIY